MAEWARRYEGSIKVIAQIRHIFLYKKLIGVTTGILPWNFPNSSSLPVKAAPALVTGNTIVIKPVKMHLII